MSTPLTVFVRVGDFVHIDWTCNLKAHLGTFEQWGPADPVMLGSIVGNCAAAVEQELFLQACHHRGNWYRITDTVVRRLIDNRGGCMGHPDRHAKQWAKTLAYLGDDAAEFTNWVRDHLGG